MRGWLHCHRYGHEFYYIDLMNVSHCLTCGKLEEGNTHEEEIKEVLYGYKLKFEVIKERRPRRVVDSRSGRVIYRLARRAQHLRTIRRTPARKRGLAGNQSKQGTIK